MVVIRNFFSNCDQAVKTGSTDRHRPYGTMVGDAPRSSILHPPPGVPGCLPAIVHIMPGEAGGGIRPKTPEPIPPAKQPEMPGPIPPAKQPNLTEN